MALSTKLRAGILSALLSQVYVSLHTSDPAETGAGELPGGTSYQRQGPVSFSSGQNATDLLWRNMPEVAAGVTHVGLWATVHGGEFLVGGELDRRKLINAGDSFVMFTGEARVAFP